MPFITIAGTERFFVEFEESEPERGGDFARAFGGNLRSSIRWTKRVWEGRLDEMSEADYLTFKTDIGDGLHITIDGDAFDASFTGHVLLQEAPYVRRGSGFNVQPAVRIREA